MKFIQYKPWDSAFFGTKIGVINSKVIITSENSKLIESEIDSERYEFLYYFSKTLLQSSRQTDLSTLVKLGFNYIDTHGTMELRLNTLNISQDSLSLMDVSLKQKKSPELSILQIFNPEEVDYPQLISLGRELSKVSRFFLDLKVPKTKVKELYDAWIANSFTGTMADYIYIIGLREKLLGFITFKKIDEEEVDLSLIGITNKERGKGVGKKLVLETLNVLRKDFSRCSVKVSMSNIGAVRFYENLGFRLKEIHQVFHAHRIHKN